MECTPTVSVAVVNDALPPLKAAIPSKLPPSKNWTLPVAPEDGVTVAVNVTCCPNAEGFCDDVNAVPVLTGFTVCVSEEDVLLVWLASPLYCAVMEWVPTTRLEIEKAATPFALS